MKIQIDLEPGETGTFLQGQGGPNMKRSMSKIEQKSQELSMQNSDFRSNLLYNRVVQNPKGQNSGIRKIVNSNSSGRLYDVRSRQFTTQLSRNS